MNHVCLNGDMLNEEEPVLKASNRSFRYGDGLFETMRLKYGSVVLGKYHFDRLYNSMKLLKYADPAFSPEKLQKDIIDLSHLNNCTAGARIRLSVFRGNGGLNDLENNAEYLIECERLEHPYTLNEAGLKLDIYPLAKKSMDVFSNIKSSNYLHSVMAARYATEKKLDDSLLINSNGNIAETSIANLFIVKNKMISTPALSEGCINGVMRRYLLEAFTDTGYEVQETVISIPDLEDADEAFLTNSIRGIQWIRSFRETNFTNELTREFFDRFIRSIQS
jgi:branched-chain amino acid aminotransferase